MSLAIRLLFAFVSVGAVTVLMSWAFWKGLRSIPVSAQEIMIRLETMLLTRAPIPRSVVVPLSQALHELKKHQDEEWFSDTHYPTGAKRR